MIGMIVTYLSYSVPGYEYIHYSKKVSKECMLFIGVQNQNYLVLDSARGMRQTETVPRNVPRP